MSERGIENRHLDLQALERYLEGTMEEWELARAERHLEGCPICRIELGYLKRFRSIDEDEELLSEAKQVDVGRAGSCLYSGGRLPWLLRRF